MCESGYEAKVLASQLNKAYSTVPNAPAMHALQLFEPGYEHHTLTSRLSRAYKLLKSPVLSRSRLKGMNI